MQPLPEVAHPFHELAFDEGVDVLVGRVLDQGGVGLDAREDVLEGRVDPLDVLGVEHARRPERRGPGPASHDVLWKEASIEGEGVVEPLEELVDLAAEATAPERLAHGRIGGGHAEAPSVAAGSGSPPSARVFRVAIRLGRVWSRMNPSAGLS